MILFGVTGGVGMGKSAIAELLRQRGASVLDTDDLARDLTAPGRPALAEISKTFGASILRPDGALNRGALADLIFADANARAALETILHPPIRARWLAEATRWREEGRELGAVIIPLLFETGAGPEFDATICVACSPATQEKRLLERGWTLEQMDARRAAQWPVERKIAQADYLIWNEAALETAGEQLEKIIDSEGTRRKTPACA